MDFEHNHCGNDMLRHKTDGKSKNNYVTITFVQLASLAAVPTGAQLDLASIIRVFDRFRRGPGSAFALVSNLYFGRLCPNYGRLCTFWGRNVRLPANWICPQSFRRPPGKFSFNIRWALSFYAKPGRHPPPRAF